MRLSLVRFRLIAGSLLILSAALANAEIWDEVEHGYADNDGVNIHYATVGEGPLVIMIHGFPNNGYDLKYHNKLNDWTEGCIALSNKEMLYLWENASKGVPVLIRK